ncbi:MAG: hypothetical protein H6667_09980 [Ardenticatenaceae bacterium]|nr:hypothetical protein [Ardenticatenaceae bacterium]
MSLIYATSESQQTATPLSSSQSIVPLPELGGIYTNRRTDGVLNAFNQAVFGPKSCTSYGDPYSPLNSVWAPGYYTYKYRILIPPDYPSDIVRVELFDPDSINSTIMTTTFSHTQIAIKKGYSITETAVCLTDQRDTCVINTNEEDLLYSFQELSYDQINPFWMIRIDENRGRGDDDGDGTCGTPLTYTTRYNTQTVFELSYISQNEDGSAESIPLARYTGQVGDGVRDNGSHLTDLHWVSPGAAPSFDQPAFVPVDANSSGSFEIDLTEDVPGIVTNPLTGYRELYLGVTAVTGSSENGFEIWAGPPTYIHAVPSEVNARNLYIMNNPQTHSSAGVTIFALDALPQNSNINTQIDLPLLYLSANYAGQTITVTAFDIEHYAPFPITFYIDTISQSDWSMTFGKSGVDDPDGIPDGVRCLPGNCSDEWIDPPYHIQLPDFTTECDPANPDPQLCTPFYGGRLMVSFPSRQNESYAWTASVPDEPVPDNTASCAALPLALSLDSLSVSPPDAGTNPYPDASEFDYPAVPPDYNSFVFHVPDVPLSQAKEGYIYRLYDGFEAGNFGWLRWNNGRPDDDIRLRNSLIWPGNSTDYEDHGYTEDFPASPIFSWIVDGYVNPGDNYDLDLNINNPVWAKTTVITSTIVQPVLNGHIDNERTLQLVVWDKSSQINGTYTTARIGVFRIVGYHLEPVTGASWIALEFSHWNTACSQAGTALAEISLVGAAKGLVQTPYTFLANVLPVTTTLPVKYIWQATDQIPVTQTNTFRDEFSFIWSQPGTKTITVTAQNEAGIIVQSTHSIFIDWRRVYLPVIVK